jgi:hypothetical protein
MNDGLATKQLLSHFFGGNLLESLTRTARIAVFYCFVAKDGKAKASP